MKEMKYQYEVWADSESETMVGAGLVSELKEKGYIGEDAKLVHVIEAATAEEAGAIYHLRMGFDPYTPTGKPQLCPQGCGSYFYPEGSGQCPYCGDIS